MGAGRATSVNIHGMPAFNVNYTNTSNMKIQLVLFIASIILVQTSMAQTNNQSSLAENVSERIADKMRDTLGLTPQLRNKIFAINMQLHQQKQAARQQYTNRDALQVFIQNIERTRDSLYQAVLPNDKYMLYKQKKKELIRAN